jgi:5-methylcytosine-specific restriction endonuclease McrA
MPYKNKAAQSAYQLAWMKRRRDAWISANGPCLDCSSTDRLEVDHVDAKSKVSHRVWSWSDARRSTELAKCVVRCRDCHVAKTLRNGEYGAKRHSERHPNTRLTLEQVREIKRLRAEGEIYRVIANQFSIGVTTAKYIVAGKYWKYAD